MRTIIALLFSIALFSCGSSDPKHKAHADESAGHDHNTGASKASEIHYEGEDHLENIHQLTYGGDNAEAYWSYDDSKLVFQATNKNWGTSCDQIYIINTDAKLDSTPAPKMISTGNGRTTCSFFMPGDTTIIYASTHLLHDSCPPVPEKTPGVYVWPLYPEFDIFISDLEGNIVTQLTDEPGYDAEATVSPTGDKIVFTSTRSGDIELYVCDLDGSNLVQVTNELGYDGGAFFSPDGTRLVYRTSRPKTDEEVKLYKDLLADHKVQPSDMEIYTCNIDGTDHQKVTDLGGANWAPYFHPSGEKIIFCSNHHSEEGFPFNLFMINIDGTGLEQITFDTAFDSFPMFSRDGKQIVFSSNRHNGRTRDTNMFIADWKD